MTREEELIAMLKTLKEQALKSCRDTAILDVKIDSFIFVIDMAIKTLEQKDVLDKIRAEIDGLTYYWCEVNPRSVIDDVLDIIDKYKAESED